MVYRIDPEFARQIAPFSEHAATRCFNCGTCTAVCPLIHDHFPRQMIRWAQIGAKEAILARAPELWRCLHCGMCNQTCPKDARPGELMLGLRRMALAERRRRPAHV